MAIGDLEPMADASGIFAVHSDIGVVDTMLVQRPLAAVQDGADDGRAAEEHGRLVQAVERLGIRVLELDRLLASTLEYADARDWTLDRRMRIAGLEVRAAARMHEWLSDLPSDALAAYLTAGVRAKEAFARLEIRAGAPPGGSELYLPPLPHLSYPRDNIRWLERGVVLGHADDTTRLCEVINLAAVLHFSPVFDEAHFDFWLASDSKGIGSPEIDGRDFALPGAGVFVGATTGYTSARALHLLAAALFRKGATSELLCVDLAGAAAETLDDCLVPLDSNCLLADRQALENARAFAIRPHRSGQIQTVETSGLSFLDLLERTLGTASARIIDAGAFRDRRVRNALACLNPIVIAPGKIVAFEQHDAAFPILERFGIEIAASVPGAALARDGRGPRSLATIVSARA
jgi:arginine deiminase